MWKEEEEEDEEEEDDDEGEDFEEVRLVGKRRDFVEALQGNYWNKRAVERLRKDADLRFRRIERVAGTCGLCNRRSRALSVEVTSSDKFAIKLGGVCCSRAMLIHMLTFARDDQALGELYVLSAAACRPRADDRLLDQCFRAQKRCL